ncbi:MAG: succinyl-diaminopimelate desuccinylase [Woeseiaceae bacterium]|nr:succinyl-diaminopimelate desuccinylase [Woeseiaceae bacterium]
MKESTANSDLKDPTTDLLCDLIRRASVTPDDAGCQSLLIERLERMGFACETLQFEDVTNLWARRGTDGPVLCLAGHTDVVPPGDLSGWNTDPFEPTLIDGLLYGRGAADMKSGIAAMVTAIERFVAACPDHDGSIAMLITSDEEGPARNGTLKVVEHLKERGESIDWCVLGEPSSHERLGDVIRIGRRGSLSGMLTVNGIQGHVAYPQSADNPIQRFAPVLHALYDIEWDQGNDYFPPTSFQFVELKAGIGAPNVTPGELYARFNFRYSTEWTHESLQQKVESVLDAHDIDYELRWHLSGEPFLTKPGRLIDAVSAVVLEETGIETEQSTGGGTSDGRFISPAGADVVELGPVNKSIHKINEHIAITDVPQLSTMYEKILKRMLG